MVRKLTIFLVFILIGMATFLVGYLFTQNSPSEQQALIDNSLVERFNETVEKYVEPTGIFELTSGTASFPTVLSNGDVWYYTPANGEVRSVSVKNPNIGSSLIARIQPNASHISWGTDKTLVANYPTGAIYYDFNSNLSKKYGTSIKNPVLFKSNDKIAYNNFDEAAGEGNITIGDPKQETLKNILPTRFAAWRIFWLNEENLALIKPPTLESTQISLFILNIKEAALQNILNQKDNLQIAWSPDGQKFIYSYNDPYSEKGGLYLTDLSIKKETPLGLDFIASKCAWGLDNKTVYCVGTNSVSYFDATNTAPEPAMIPNSQNINATASDLLLTNTGDYLIFKNSKDGKLYGLRLK